MGFILKIIFSTKRSIPIKWKNALISDSWLTTSFLKEVLWVLRPVRLAKWEQIAALTTHLRSRKREETQTPTPDQPCDCCISLPSSHPCTPSTSQTHTNVWEKARIPQKSLETKARATFSTKSLQKRERFPSNYYHIITISWKKNKIKTINGMKSDVRGWREPYKAIGFEGFGPVYLTYKRKPSHNNEGWQQEY